MASKSSRPDEKKTKKKGMGKKAKMSEGVVSCTKKLCLTEEAFASFGGQVDIFRKEKVTSEGGTISFVLDTKRQFEPGQYVMHIVQMEVQNKVAILCLEDLCPLKIHNRLKKSNMGQDFSASNYMNRYDWFHMQYVGSGGEDEEFGQAKRKFINVIRRDVLGEDVNEDEEEDEEEDEDRDYKLSSMCFFVDVKYLDDISAGRFSCERDNDWVFVMKGTGNGEPIIGFIVQGDESGCGDNVFTGEDTYGCVLVDQTSAKCFAFVFGSYYTYKNQGRQPHDFDICKINYTFDKAYFQKGN